MAVHSENGLVLVQPRWHIPSTTSDPGRWLQGAGAVILARPLVSRIDRTTRRLEAAGSSGSSNLGSSASGWLSCAPRPLFMTAMRIVLESFRQCA